MEEARRPKARVACAALAALSAVVVWHLIWRVGDSTWPPPSPFTALSRGYWLDLLVLAFAVVLVLPAPRASGVTIGSIREHWKPTLLVCGLPVLVTIAAIPYLRGLPWGGQPSSFWTVQPLAQDLLFFGFVYRVFEAVLSGRVAPWLPVGKPLFATALVFAAWHLPNWRFLGPGDLAIQLAYAFAGACFVGLARQWTGSILYGLATHTTVNFIAWAVSC